MTRVHNFSAGPAALPLEVLERAREEWLDWRGQGASVLELSHRDRAFVTIAERAEADLRALLEIPNEYRVLFLQGGATQHFAQIPLNLARPDQPVDYVLTGQWGQKAAKEAGTLAQVRIAASSEAEKFTTVPDPSTWRLSEDAAYLHLTPNETIHGVEFEPPAELGERVIVADMSSTLLSRPLDVRRYGLIYAGAQKNLGPAGLTVLIVREDLLARKPRPLPAILTYAKHAEQGSMLNTPPTFAWYLAGLVFQWLRDLGGVEEMAERNLIKAKTLYDYIDGSGFYRNPVDPRFRSWMNVPFFLPDPALDVDFLKGAQQAGLIGLKGHRDLGGMRASLYNAVPQAAVDALVAYMADFARRHG